MLTCLPPAASTSHVTDVLGTLSAPFYRQLEVANALRDEDVLVKATSAQVDAEGVGRNTSLPLQDKEMLELRSLSKPRNAPRTSRSCRIRAPSVAGPARQ
jgi:hypothetical protein